MKKALKITLWLLLGIVVLLTGTMALFIYKITYGFPVSYETERPSIDIPEGKRTVLLFSKSTGFRHSESIDAGKAAFAEWAEDNGWFLFSTEESGVFNPDQLPKFDVIVFNNCTGRLLNDEQQLAVRQYVTQGGSFIGIHGAGDNSHHWEWYEENLLGANFSHHSIDPHLQSAVVSLNPVPDTLLLAGLPATWTHTEEWYVFLENPRSKGFNILYAIDGESISPSGNMLWMKDKNFGMGKDHPVAWYRAVGKGRTFYTSMGHDATAWKQEPFTRMLQNAINAE
jgi:type 1 glutamine amidotransferase